MSPKDVKRDGTAGGDDGSTSSGSNKSSGSKKKGKPTVTINAQELLKLQDAVGETSATKADMQRDKESPPTQMSGTRVMRSKSMSRAVPYAWRFLFDSRYRMGRKIGEGGMGVVHEAFDRSIGRMVAVKMLKDPLDLSSEQANKLIREIQVTGQLEHPNIMPIYDVGVMEDNRLFFAMKLIRGRDMKEIIDDLAFGVDKTIEAFSLFRLLNIFRQVCLAVEFAHSRGVLHRELKPANVMLGDLGEVLVLDWGLAHIRAFDEPMEGVIRAPQRKVQEVTVRKTMEGSIMGTPCYMAPEQAAGQNSRVSERSDVFGLGGLLYEMLTFLPPITGKDAIEVLSNAALCKIRPLHEAAPERRYPADLEYICNKALQKEPEDRFATVHELRQAVEGFLEGSREARRRREQAREELEAGRGMLKEYYQVRERYLTLVARVQQCRNELKTKPVSLDQKEEMWQAEEELRQVSMDAARLYTDTLQHLQSGLELDPDNREFSNLLADLFWDRFLEAEERDNPEDRYFFRSQVERYHHGRYDHHLAGQGNIEVACDTPGAAITVTPFAERKHRLMAAGEAMDAGTAPWQTTLTRGHYLISVSAPGCITAHYPVFIDRLERMIIDARPIPSKQVRPGFAYIPPGEALLGDDSAGTFGALPRARRFVDAFCMGVVPVTVAEYLEFLNDIRHTLPPEELRNLLPAPFGSDSHYLRELENGDFACPQQDAEGDEWSPHWPIIGVTFENAQAYCRWRSARDGIAYRLPTNDEWEKAARGLDARMFPWGNRFDSSFCRMRFTDFGRPNPVSVGSYLTDCSPYGVLDCAGNVRDWCDDWFDDQRAVRVIRGGAWSMYEMFSRLSCRTSDKPTMRSVNIGFRLAYSVAPREP